MRMDPAEIEDHTFGWATQLASGETVTAAEVTVTPAGLTIAPTGRPTVVNPDSVTAWVTGGTSGTTYTLRCQVETSGGRRYVEVRRILVLTR